MNFIKRFATIAVLATALSSCSGKKPRVEAPDYGPVPVPVETPVPNEQVGPEAPSGPVLPPDYVPPKDGYVLVLGPGLARGLAFIGVLHELESKRVGVTAIVGVEIGSVVGGLWASSNLNNLEWEMHKFNRKTLLDVPLLRLGDRVAEGKRLYSFLGKALRVDQLQKMKVPMIVAYGVLNDSVYFEDSGSAKDIIRGAMGIPGVIRPYSWEGRDRITAALEAPYPAEKAKDLGVGEVVCVDVIGRGDNFKPKDATEEQLSLLMKSVAVNARSQLKNCDHVISIPTDGISYLDFEAKADLIYRGKVAIQKWLVNK